MENFGLKFKLIFIPFLIIAVCTVTVYLLFIYLFIIRKEVFSIDEKYVEFYIPGAIPWIPLIIWLRPRIKYLKLNTVGRRDPVFNFVMLAGAIIGLTASFSQHYLITATGKLTYIDSVGQINKLPPTKYYKLKRAYINKKMFAQYNLMSVTGKHNENLVLSIYVPMPITNDNSADTVDKSIHLKYMQNSLLILDQRIISEKDLSNLNPDSVEDIQILRPPASVALYGRDAKYGVLLITTKSRKNKVSISHQPRSNDYLPVYKSKPALPNKALANNVWLAVKYTTTVDNSKSQLQNEAMFKEFAARTLSEFDGTNFNSFIYLDRLGINADRTNYRKAIAEHYNINDPTLLLPVYTPFELHNGNTLKWLAAIFVGGSALFLFILQFFSLRPEYLSSDPA